MKRLATRFFSAFFLLLITAFIIPKEGIHAFSGHEDTEHHDFFSAAEKHIEEAHHHCVFLKIEAPEYITSEHHDSHSIVYYPYVFAVLSVVSAQQSEVDYTCLRGPPLS